jgi:serine/threonine protein kinase
MAIESLGSFEGKYEILERIGEGGMGAVYKVRHRLMNEIRVIKTMRAHLTDREESRERFYREARIAARVKHENIARVLDFSMDKGTAFLVIEYIDGVTLQEVLAIHGPPTLRLGLEIAQQSLRALAMVHRTGIIHRDISPDNLMLTTDSEGYPQIKLIDLGLAKITEAESGLTKEGFFLGKLRYASPEQFQANQDVAVGSWSDVYSFGLVFYELLTGRYPVRGKDMPGLMAGHLTQPPIPFADSDPDNLIPEDVRRTILRALEKNSDNRFPNGEAFHDQVRLIQMDHPLGTEEREEAVRLSTRPPGEKEAAKPGSSQEMLVSRAFPADKSSGDTSRATEITGSVELSPSDPDSLSVMDYRRIREAEEAASGVSSEPKLGETVIRDDSVVPVPEPSTERLDVSAHRKPQPPEIDPPTRPDVRPVSREEAASIEVIERTLTKQRTTSPRRDTKKPGRRRLWMALAAAGVLFIAVTGLQIAGVISLPVFGPAGEDALTAIPTGTLIINATPWAEIVEVSNGDGAKLELPEAAYTPMALSVNPGSYRIVLRNEDFGEKTVTAEVEADQTTNEPVSLAEIGEAEFLRSLGLMQ